MRENHFPLTDGAIDLDETGTRRMAVPGISDAILGGLFYLYDTHVHDANGHSGSYYDFLISAEKARKPLPWLASAFRRFLGKHIFKERHLKGTWPAYIHFLADLKKLHARPLFVVTDYNLFTTASTAYSLLLFEDNHLPENKRIVELMLGNACKVIADLKRGGAYNFWQSRYDPKNYPVSAPLNIPVFLLDIRWYIFKYTGLLSLKNFPEADLITEWVISCYNKRENPAGGEAFFNIPDDADNTSMAVAFRILCDKKKAESTDQKDIAPLEYLSLFRDRNRTKSDRHNKIFGKDTGAFLTWFKDENIPIFSSPEKGVIPLAVNNVDIVINSNVIFALSLANMQSAPGYTDAVNLLAKTIREYTWPDASLYYPQKYIFPYAVSRAWRDAGARDPVLDLAMEQLMLQILDEMAALGENLPQPASSPSRNGHHHFQQSTALGLITLLNLGREMAENCGRADQYDQIVRTSVGYLILNSKTDHVRQKSIIRQFPGVKVNFWEPGIMYSSSVKQLAHWRSHAQSTSIVIEALAKYLLAYDLCNNDLLSRRLSLDSTDQGWSLSILPAK
jgi:hypothetical protein